jgi:hypothetical protein
MAREIVTSENRDAYMKQKLGMEDEKEQIRKFFEKNTKDYLKEAGNEEAILPNGMVKVYHGTSEKNLKGILKDKKFKGHPFFSHDKEIAEKYSKQAGKNPVVHEMQVHPSALTTTGNYLTARMEGLKQHPEGHWDY